ncbi:hypothetical protein LJY25_14480 [Hymenobacter sp. BT175]|uniref:WD40/YVTN/BNR-like repeat-containing protein n=1 Tax=Hymenobacter translucens TaxID=2886507 RepID=UPI001D0EB9C1|nr:hypothetical protein [Hymenobacter translucens]MCC2547658.1 hypothetical protein [Hymenobacter translucens]
MKIMQLCGLLLLLPLLCGAQTPPVPADVTLQLVQPDSDHQFFLMSRPSGIPGKKVSHYMVVRYLREGKEVKLPLTPLDSARTCAGWPTTNVNIFFVNNQLGFLYGSTIGYGYCSFTYRTVDGGKSWTRVMLDAQQRADAAYRDALFMFNEKQGIILAYLLKGRLTYYLTADGGLSWTEKCLPILAQEISGHAHGLGTYLQPFYSKSGSIVLVTKQEVGLAPVSFTVFRSEDFGQSFRIMK